LTKNNTTSPPMKNPKPIHYEQSLGSQIAKGKGGGGSEVSVGRRKFRFRDASTVLGVGGIAKRTFHKKKKKEPVYGSELVSKSAMGGRKVVQRKSYLRKRTRLRRERGEPRTRF